MTLESDAKFKEKPICFKKWQEFGEFWSEHSKVSKICTLTCPFWAKFITFDLRKSKEELHFHDTEEWCKIWRKTDLWFDSRNLANFQQCMSLKFTEELCVKTMKNVANFEEELTCCFKIDMRTLTWALGSLKLCALTGSF